MKDLLDEMQRALADLMLSGYSSGRDTFRKFQQLAEACARSGLHTGAVLMEGIARDLENRSHALQKEDLALTAGVCRAVRYTELCKEKLQETDIETRWNHITGGNP